MLNAKPKPLNPNPYLWLNRPPFQGTVYTNHDKDTKRVGLFGYR